MSHTELATEHFLSLEQKLHKPDFRSSRETVSDLLADTFVEFGSSGRVYDKMVVVDALAEETGVGASTVPEVKDFAATYLSPDTVLVTYRSIRQSTKITKERQTLRSSIWKLNDGRWQMLFHQGTIAAVE